MDIKTPLVKDTIDKNDTKALAEWLLTNPRLTKGPETLAFEQEWSEWLGTKYSIFCNSGSSANLLMLYALIAAKKLKNQKVVVPSLAWATDLAPVVQFGMEPIICDINTDNLSVHLGDLEEIFKKESPSVLMLVSVLGLTPNMTYIVDLCKKYDVILLEDTCESLGSEHQGKKLGNFGLMSTFSLYFGHHLSTIEGGMVCTNDEEMCEVLKSIRSHGWDRDASEEYKNKWRDKWGTEDFNGMYTFYYPGFNVRSTDLQAFIGRRQIKKADEICKLRSDNFQKYQDRIINPTWKPATIAGDYTSSFCYPVLSIHRDKIVEELKANGVEVRPLICGSMATQPFYIERYGRKELGNVKNFDEYGFYVPNNDKITDEEITLICNIINKYTNEQK